MNKNAAEFKKKKKRDLEIPCSLQMGWLASTLRTGYFSVLGLDVTVINKWQAI